MAGFPYTFPFQLASPVVSAPTAGGLTLTGFAPTVTASATTVAFVSAGAGAQATGSSTTLSTSWLHTINNSDEHTVVIISVCQSISANGTSTGATVTYGGNAATLLPTTEQRNGSTTSRSRLALYAIWNPPTGEQTVTLTSTGSQTVTAIGGNSAAYGGAEFLTSSVSSIATVPANGSTGDYFVAAHSSDASITAVNHTQRGQLLYHSVAGLGDSTAMQDYTDSGAEVSFVATTAGSNRLSTALCIRAYAAPTPGGPHVVGLTQFNSSNSSGFTVNFSDGKYIPQENDVAILFPAVLATSVTVQDVAGWTNPLGSGVDVETNSHEMSCVWHKITAAEQSAGTRAWTLANYYSTNRSANISGVIVRGVDPNAVIDAINSTSNSSNVSPHVLASLAGAGLSSHSLVVSAVQNRSQPDGYHSLPSGWRFLSQNSSSAGQKAVLTRSELTTTGADVAATNITPDSIDKYISITVAFSVLILELIEPGAATLTLTGSAPTVRTPEILKPAGGSLALSGAAPTVVAADRVVVTPGTSKKLPYELPFTLGDLSGAELFLTGSTPRVIAAWTLTPAHADLTLTGYAPEIANDVVLTPGGAVLTGTGAGPVITYITGYTWPGAAQLALTGGAPSVWVSGVTPPSATLVISGWPPTLNISTHITTVDVDVGFAHTVEELQQQMLNGDLVSRGMAADQLAEYRAGFDKTWIITIYDKMWVPVGEFGDDVMEASGILPRNKLPTMTLKVKGGSQHIDRLMSCKDTMVGITVETGGMRVPYYVDTFDMEYSDAAWVGTASCLGIYDILNYMQIWPNFLLPIQVQIPGFAVFIGPMCTVLEVMISEQALRIQSGLWEFINNALSLNPDIRAWFGTILQSGLNIFEILKHPVYVIHTNPFFDGSPLVARTVRMESCGAVIEDLTRAYGVEVRVDLWLPGDEQPDFWTQTVPFLSLDQPTYVVTVKDRSQITGPTGTILDSVIRTIVDVGGSFFGDIAPIITQVPGMDGVWYSPILGQSYVPPWAIIIAPDNGEDGSVVDCKLSFHTPKGWQHIIGGRSPKWLNDLVNAFTAWLMDSIAILIGITGFPSNLLEGFLNNVFLAFQLIEHYGRRNAVGPYHPAIEVFHATASAPYNVETFMAFVNALWDSRGYVSGQFTFRDGEVYKLGVDIFPHGLVSLVYHGRKKLFTDYLENILFRYTPDARDVMCQVGDGKAEEAPLAKHQRFLTGVLESINVITLAPSSQGFL